MINYTPFDKELADLDEQELQKLIDRGISEGWYIEYKADIPKKAGKLDSTKIVKAISAFANTKGGWLFYGINSDEKNIATSLCGLDLSQYNNLADQISQTISANIAPKPIYHLKTVLLETGNYVLVIKVEESPTPPYITSQGVIYQRENNESNPIKDRYIIEKLSEKTDEYYQAIDRFSKMDYGETKGQSEEDQSYLELYLFPLPYNDFHFKNFFETDFFKQVAAIFYQNVDVTFHDKEEKINIPLNLGFNSIYSSHNSLIIRPLNNRNLIYKTTTVELFYNGGLKFLIPLTEFSMGDIPKHYINSDVINYLRNKYSYFQERSSSHIKMIDGMELVYVLLIIVAKYKAILENSDFELSSEIGFRVKLTDIWRKFLFFDNADYLEKIKMFNIPIAPKNVIEVPRFTKGSYYTTEINNYSFFEIARLILDAIGLPDSSTIQFWDMIKDGVEKYKVPDWGD